MATIVTRSGKGAALTFTELDANFTNLNTDKIERNLIVNDATTGLKISQYGSGRVLECYDESADITPFVVENTGNIGIGGSASSINGKLQITSSITGGNPEEVGNIDSNQITKIGTAGASLRTGMYFAGHTWFQSSNASDYSVKYDILLNPLGGKVGIGTHAAEEKLQVGELNRNGNLKLYGFYQNYKYINTSVTLPVNTNSMLIGEVGISSGVTITIPDGASLTIV